MTTRAEHRYDERIAGTYDKRLPRRFALHKEQCFQSAPIPRGARVLVFCCGTGLDFGALQRRIGPDGFILGVDLSDQMLSSARARVQRAGWENVELLCADVTAFAASKHAPFDVGICTLGMSIIPRSMRAYRRLADAVKPSGTVIVADMGLIRGALSPLNALVIALARPYGGSFRGHRDASRVADLMARELRDVERGDYDWGSYFVCWGTKHQ